MDDWNLNGKQLGKWLQSQHCKSIIPKCFQKEWQIMLGLHIVLVTQYKWFTVITYWARQIELGDTIYNT